MSEYTIHLNEQEIKELIYALDEQIRNYTLQETRYKMTPEQSCSQALIKLKQKINYHLDIKNYTNEDLDNMTEEEEKKFFEDHNVYFTEEMIGNQKVRIRNEDWTKTHEK